jgi:hypothetical protein
MGTIGIIHGIFTYSLEVVNARMQQCSQAYKLTADGILQTVRCAFDFILFL